MHSLPDDMKVMDQPKQVIFVCTGNICRSPMAEGFFHAMVPPEKGWTASSAGLAATPGSPPSSHSVTAMNELGIDITRQRSQLLTKELIDTAERIVVMTYGHLDAILAYFPAASEKVCLLRQFIEPPLPAGQIDLSDPIGLPLESYRLCRDQVQEAMPSLLKELGI